MENITTVAYRVQANSPAPLFRVVGGAVVSSYRPVTGQQCCGFGGAVTQVDSVSGQEPAGAAAVLGLRAYGPVQVQQTEQVQLVQQAERARLRLVGDAQPGAEALLARVHRFDGTTTGTATGMSSSNGSENGSNGSKPMTPWGYRTSSPPG